MDLSELRKSRRIAETRADAEQINALLAVAMRDMEDAGILLKNSRFDGAYTAAYNAMLQTTRALMFSYGFRPAEEEHHKIAIEFAECILPQEIRPLVRLFDRMRRKRHENIYDVAGKTSEFQAREALETAYKYVSLLEKRIREKMASNRT